MPEVCAADDLDDGDVEGFEVDGEEILVAKVDGEFHAIGDVCTHQRCLLSDGWLEGDEIVCPCHSAKFDLETGEATRPPATEPEPTYDVMVEDGAVVVELEGG
ncbi:MAG: non-heme iron oxygenase ferredoxin subunit [Candidatus Nanohaloarchaea archaeon]|nr:non-heme iron oxygenase ferredoxin subunit [Candidatus Nanohaloarchaea archaeon]